MAWQRQAKVTVGYRPPGLSSSSSSRVTGTELANTSMAVCGDSRGDIHERHPGLKRGVRRLRLGT
jgi:hypothetical protein